METINRVSPTDRLLVKCVYYARYADGFNSIASAINDCIKHNITHRNTPDTFIVTNYTKNWTSTYKRQRNGCYKKMY